MNYDDYLCDMKRLCGGKWPHDNKLSPMPIFQRRRVNERIAGMRMYEVCAHVDVFDKAGRLDMCLFDVLEIYAVKRSNAWEIAHKEFNAMKANATQSGMALSIGQTSIKCFDKGEKT
ncbi:MAG: hypothetical protein IJH50_04790 [Kiritimatiellae bacterium]|nr:hypothetical protein [Kiritimatiellia bacterium]